MNFVDMFNTIESTQPESEQVDTQLYQPTYTDQQPANWEEAFTGFKTHPVLYNMDGYISPYASGNWGSVSNILKTLDDTSRLPALSDRIDPNKIFTSDISALRVLAADQQKITKMFEKKLVEGLTERGKVGLDENDIMAMQALTAARSAVTNINEKQITIKKHIADIKIKQQSTSDGNYNSSDSSTGKGLSAYDVGRSMMDSIFEHGNAVIPTTEYTPAASTDDASQLIEDLIPTPENTYVQYEAAGPKTYVVVGDSDSDAEYVTFSDEGVPLPDYPNPSTKIDIIDRNAGTATDELLRQYPLKQK